jgi:ADP-ribose pyrophosphatase YjhB (NUDIX family)
MGAKVHPGGKKPPPMTGNEAHVFVKSPNAERAKQLCAIAERCGFASSIHPDTDKCLEELGQLMKDNRVLPSAIIVDIYDENGDGMVDEDEMCWPLLRMVQRPHAPFDERLKRVFVCVISRDVAESPRLTLDALGAGAKMVTDNDDAVKEALDLLRLTSVKGKGVRGESSGTKRGEVRCPVCQLPGLSPPLLYGHYSLCHVTEPGPDGTCPLCPQVCRAGHGFTPFARHLEDCHAPDGLDENQDGHISAEELRNSMKKMVNTKAAKKNLEEMFRASAVTIGPEKYAAYAWLVVRRPSDGKYLMVLESAHTSGCHGKPRYWLPAGKCDPGETLVEAAVRSCAEDTHVTVKPMGVLRLMLEPSAKKSLRVILYAEPVDNDPNIVVPKSVPDFHSVGAIWVDPGDLEDLNENEYRNPDPPKFFPGVEEGTIKAHPLDTDAWNNLEGIVKELTASPDPQKRDSQIPAAWDACERTYKSACHMEAKAK